MTDVDNRLKDLCAGHPVWLQAKLKAAYWMGVSDALNQNKKPLDAAVQDLRIDAFVPPVFECDHLWVQSEVLDAVICSRCLSKKV